MADPVEPNVVDGVPELEKDILLLAVEEARLNWLQLLDSAGDRVFEPGAAGEWNLRDVQAHVNAYYRFLLAELGGQARPIGEMPAETDTVQKRNELLHEQDKDLPWSFVFNESVDVADELRRLIDGWTQEDLRVQMAAWHPWPRWRWIVSLTVGHYDEHVPLLKAFLEGQPALTDN